MKEFAHAIMRQFYSVKDENGKPLEEFEDIVRRCTNSVIPVSNRQLRNQFRAALSNFDFIPNSPTLMNAGTDLGQLSACFVLPINDSIPEIYDTIRDTAIIHKSGGGTGFSFSRIRPRGATVRSTGGIASGPLSFMRVFDASVDVIKQGGKRRGANMGILRIDHPDIREFIACKDSGVDFTNFNLSIAVTAEFLRALEGQGEYPSHFCFDESNYTVHPNAKASPEYMYRLVDPRDQTIIAIEDAREIWQIITHCAWLRGNPGLFFMDLANNCSPTIELIESTNPCGEIPLLAYESCNLGAINYLHCVKNGEVDWDKLERLVILATRYLNCVIDANKYPLPQIEENTLKHRKIGLGPMGFADMCFAMGIVYGSPECIYLIHQVQKFIAAVCKRESTKLFYEARDAGHFNFSKYEWDAKSVTEYLVATENAIEIYKQNRRDGGPATRADLLWEEQFVQGLHNPVYNKVRLTAAPTGTTAILAGVSGGIEPNFSLVYQRLVNSTDKYTVANRPFVEYCQREGWTGDVLEARLEELYKTGSIRNCDWATDDMKRLFVGSQDVPWEQHILVQAAFQRYIDNSVSKTINLPHEATEEDVAGAYALAIAHNLKGLTVYRDGSIDNQTLSTKKSYSKEPAQSPEENTNPPDVEVVDYKGEIQGCTGNCAGCPKTASDGEFIVEDKTTAPYSVCEVTDKGYILPRPRARVLTGRHTYIRTGCGKLYIGVNCDEHGLAEVFTGFGNGGCEAQTAALTRVISVSLRSGVAPEELIEQCRAVPCKAAQGSLTAECRSCSDAIGRVMQMVLDGAEMPALIKKYKRPQSDTIKVTEFASHREDVKTPGHQTRPVESEGNSIQASAHDIDALNFNICPNCGARLHHSEGCVSCDVCLWSRCR